MREQKECVFVETAYVDGKPSKMFIAAHSYVCCWLFFGISGQSETCIDERSVGAYAMM
jgi:hypothetical protein